MFTAPFQRPRVYKASIIVDGKGCYRGAIKGREPGRLARVAVVDDDQGEPWAAVAWLTNNPVEWWIGKFPFPPHQSFPPIMGAAEVVFASDWDADLLLVETPDRWVELATSAVWAGPTACVLAWDRPDAVSEWLSLVKVVLCETPALARALKSVLGAVPAPQRLSVRLTEPVKPAVEAPCICIDIDHETASERLTLRECAEERHRTQREEIAA
jgi:hypothetical protein